MSTLDTIVLVYGVLLGAVLGSFSNVCIWRLPRECMSILRPRSRCNSCLQLIRWYDNIPVVSFVVLGGRCRNCASPISLRYPVVEILTALLFGILASKWLVPVRGLTYDGIGVFLAQGYVVVSLVISTFIDFEWRIIPDEVSVAGVLIAPLASALFPHLHLRAALAFESEVLTYVTWWVFSPLFACLVLWVILFWKDRYSEKLTREVWKKVAWGAVVGVPGGSALVLLFGRYMFEQLRTGALLSSLLGMFVGGGFIYLLGLGGKLMFRREAMGFGDVKLMAMVGGFLGWDGVVLATFLGAFVGAISGIVSFFVTKDRYIPFGPYLSIGAVVCLFFGVGFLDIPELV